MNSKKLISGLLAAAMSLCSAGQAFPAAAEDENVLLRADNGLTAEEIAASAIQPKAEATRIVLPHTAAGRKQEITVSVNGAEGKYASLGMHLAYDSRLVADTDEFGDVICTKGADSLSKFTGLKDPTFTGDWSGVFFSAYDSADKGHDGNIATITVTIPKEAQPGDVFPIDIVYKDVDRFTSYYSLREESKLMEAFFFTQGIYNEEYNNSFRASDADIANVKALADIPGYCDGYIAIADDKDSNAADGGYTPEEIDISPVKPQAELSKLVIPASSAGDTVTVKLSLNNCSGMYNNLGLHFRMDDRISVVSGDDPDDLEIVKGDALQNCPSLVSRRFNEPEEGWNEYGIMNADTENNGTDGDIALITIKIPDNAKPGDVYPLDIIYQSGNMFNSDKLDHSTSMLMKAYFFTRGIFNEEYNNNFTASEEDIAKVKALADIAGYCDGYIAIEDDIAVNDEDLLRADNGFSAEQIAASAIKPKAEATKIVLPASAAGTKQKITISVSGADREYASLGMHFAFDSRLVPDMNPFGDGPDIKNAGTLSNFKCESDENFPDGWTGVFFSSYDTADKGTDSDLATLMVTIPENAKPGDVYPIDIVYKELDIFAAYKSLGNVSRLMEAYLFTQGIYNEEYNNNFRAHVADIAKVTALEDIPGYCDGYIAIEDEKTTASADGGFTQEQIEASPVKAKAELSKLVVPASAAGETVTVKFSLSDCAGEYSNLGLHFRMDDRMEVVVDQNSGKLGVVKGDALKECPSLTAAIVSDHEEGWNEYGLMNVDMENNGTDGDIAIITVKIPDNAKPGDVYPLDINYEPGSNFKSFEKEPDDSNLMQAYFFTRGIFNKEYNNNFKASAEDIARVKALADIAGYCDGYIAVEDDTPATATTTVSTTTKPADTTTKAAATTTKPAATTTKAAPTTTKPAATTTKAAATTSKPAPTTTKAAATTTKPAATTTKAVPTTTKPAATTTKTVTTAPATTTVPVTTTKVGADGGFTIDQIVSSHEKPVSFLTKELVYDSEAGDERTIEMRLEGCQYAYTQFGIHIRIDSRLEIQKDSSGKLLVEKGGALGFTGSFGAEIVSQDEEWTELFIHYSGKNDYCTTGTVFKITVKIPENAAYNDVYPLDLLYRDGDYFTNNNPENEASRLMQAYFFTYGICDGERRVFDFTDEHWEALPALEDLSYDCDGYIGVCKAPETTTVTTTATTSTTTEAATTTKPGADGGFTKEEIQQSPFKPTVRMGYETVPDTMIGGEDTTLGLMFDEFRNTYVSFGVHIRIDSRLELKTDEEGKLIINKNFRSIENAEDFRMEIVSCDELWTELYIQYKGISSDTKVSLIIPIVAKIPDTLIYNEVYPEDIIYRDGDYFTGADPESMESRLMQAYFFTEGIHSKEYNNTFTALERDIEEVPALADIDPSYDGYVGVRKGIVVTTATTTAPEETTTTAVPVIIPDGKFRDGINNWSFNNSNSNFYYYSDLYKENIYYMTQEDYDKLIEGVTEEELYRISYGIIRKWGGSCFGMSCLAILSCYGIFDPSERDINATTLFNATAPPTDDIESAINYYHSLYRTDMYLYWAEDAANLSEQEKTKRIIEEAESGRPFIIPFFYTYIKDGIEKNGGHAIVGYDIEDTNYVYNDKTYNKRIITYDPNYIYYDEDVCMYIDTYDGEWVIPRYGAESLIGSTLGCISSNLDYLNYHGLFHEKTNEVYESFSPSPLLTAYSVNSTPSIQTIILEADGTYTISPNSKQTIKKYTELTDGSSDINTINFILDDPGKAYLLKLDKQDNVDLMMSMSEDLIHLRFNGANEVIIDPTGMVKAVGDSSDFSITMVSNDGYSPTDWNRVDITGEGAQVEFRRTDEGYVLSGDNLKDVKVSAEGDTYEPACTFSTDKDTVLIHEITEDKIGISVDEDNNGTFEKEIETVEVINIRLGDINSDGIVDANDASEILSLYAQASTGGEIDEETKNIGDVNKDGLLDSTDASLILEYYALASTSSDIKSDIFFRLRPGA